MLIVGSPTHGGRPTEAVKTFLDAIPAGGLKGIKVAAFDTRMTPDGQPWWLQKIINFFGYAAPRIAKVLVSNGGTQVKEPEGFIVEGKEGPLVSTIISMYS
jgi:hypothetical protein